MLSLKGSWTKSSCWSCQTWTTSKITKKTSFSNWYTHCCCCWIYQCRKNITDQSINKRCFIKTKKSIICYIRYIILHTITFISFVSRCNYTCWCSAKCIEYPLCWYSWFYWWVIIDLFNWMNSYFYSYSGYSDGINRSFSCDIEWCYWCPFDNSCLWY